MRYGEYGARFCRGNARYSHRIQVANHVAWLEPDVAEVFPDSESVNEALRFLIRITREHKPTLSGPGSGA